MNGLILFLAAGLGIQYGWQQRDDGTVEYIIQVDEAGLEALKDGLPLTSAVPAELSRIDRIRIQVGTGELPRTPIANSLQTVDQQQLSATRSSAQPAVFDAQASTEEVDSASFNSTSASADSTVTITDAARIKAADTVPQLVQTYWTAKQNQWNTTPNYQTAPAGPPQPSSGGMQTVRNSTLSQYNGFPAARTADAGNQQTQVQAPPNQQQTFNTQGDPQATGTYNPNQFQAQPTANSNSTLDSRQGTITFGSQSPEYQNNFSAQTAPRNNSFDSSLRSNQANNLEAVTPRWTLPPNPAYPSLQQPPNAAFNSQQNPLAAGGQNNASALYQNGLAYQQQPLYPQTLLPPIAANPYVSPYAAYAQPSGLQPPALLPYPNASAYADPYLRTRIEEKSQNEIADLRKEFKDVLAEMTKRDEIASTKTQASLNELANQKLALDAEKPVSSSPNWTIAILTMLVSIGANFYLAWIALSFYHRYRSLAEDMRDMNRFEPQ